MFCLAANYNAPHNNTPMLGVHAREAGLARVFEMDDQWFRLGDHGRYPAPNALNTHGSTKQKRNIAFQAQL